jgi:enamine deaminase RidA (YjgF/YER057c/UK114 family)
MANRLHGIFNMSRLAASTHIALAISLIVISTSICATEIARYDDGPFAGMGYPYSESARVGNLLFLAGQIGEDARGDGMYRRISRLGNQVFVTSWARKPPHQ